MAHDNGSGNEKRGTKGIPHSIPIEMNHFRDVLYQTTDEMHTVTYNSLTLNKQKQMCRTSMFKKACPTYLLN